MTMKLSTFWNPQLSLRDYIDVCVKHGRKYWWQYLLPVAVIGILQIFVRLDVNYTDSLPDHAFITVKGWRTGLKHGDYVAYEFPTESPISPFRKGSHMVKLVGGVPGDTVTMDEQGNFRVVRADDSKALQQLGGSVLATAKTHTKTGKPIKPGPVGVIPEGHYFVFAPHKDSLDSRYEITGWIPEANILGRTFPIDSLMKW